MTIKPILIVLTVLGLGSTVADADPVVPPLKANTYYTSCGERFMITDCGGATDNSYCLVQYPDHPRKPGGTMYQNAETRGALIKRLQACGQLPGGGGASSSSSQKPVTSASVAAANTAASAPKSGAGDGIVGGRVVTGFCTRKEDVGTCVVCVQKDCKIGGASAVSKTGAATVDLGNGKRIGVTPPAKMYLGNIRAGKAEYIMLYLVESPTTADPLYCLVDISDAGEVVEPEAAAEFVINDQAGQGAEVERQTYRVGKYTGLIDVRLDAAAQQFNLRQHLIYENVEFLKACTYKDRPALNEAHFLALDLSLLAPGQQAQ